MLQLKVTPSNRIWLGERLREHEGLNDRGLLVEEAGDPWRTGSPRT